MTEQVWGIAMVRDEADIIEFTIRHMLSQVHHVLVADNVSTDGTYEKLVGLTSETDRLDVVVDDEPGYYQSQKMSNLARLAAQNGADWVVPFDADEFWYPTEGLSIIDILDDLNYVQVPCRLVEHVPTPRDRPLSPWRWKGFRGQQKVAIRPALPALIHQGNHAASYPKPIIGPADILYARHFPYRSAKQFVSKVRNGCAAYAAAPELPKGMGSHWRNWGELLEREGVPGLQKLFREQILVQAPSQVPKLIRDDLGRM